MNEQDQVHENSSNKAPLQLPFTFGKNLTRYTSESIEAFLLKLLEVAEGFDEWKVSRPGDENFPNYVPKVIHLMEHSANYVQKGVWWMPRGEDELWFMLPAVGSSANSESGMEMLASNFEPPPAFYDEISWRMWELLPVVNVNYQPWRHGANLRRVIQTVTVAARSQLSIVIRDDTRERRKERAHVRKHGRAFRRSSVLQRKMMNSLWQAEWSLRRQVDLMKEALKHRDELLAFNLNPSVEHQNRRINNIRDHWEQLLVLVDEYDKIFPASPTKSA